MKYILHQFLVMIFTQLKQKRLHGCKDRIRYNTCHELSLFQSDGESERSPLFVQVHPSDRAEVDLQMLMW